MRRIVIVVSAGVLLVLLVLAQLILPGIAAQRLRDRLSRNGTVLHVEVHAFPAIELLWQQADRVVIKMGEYHSSSPALGSSLSQAEGAGSLDASAGVVRAGLLTLRDATLRKRGDQLTGSARVTEADLRAAAPFLQSVVPVSSGNGQLTLRGTASLFGVTATVDATVTVRDGKLLVAPDVPFGGFATLTLFSNPRVEIEAVSARPTADGFAVTATARLH
jgi:LmeA-like phospholipid-binding